MSRSSSVSSSSAAVCSNSGSVSPSPSPSFPCSPLSPSDDDEFQLQELGPKLEEAKRKVQKYQRGENQNERKHRKWFGKLEYFERERKRIEEREPDLMCTTDDNTAPASTSDLVDDSSSSASSSSSSSSSISSSTTTTQLSTDLIATAIDLKNAIDNIEQFSRAIGKWKSREDEFLGEYGNDHENDEEQQEEEEEEGKEEEEEEEEKEEEEKDEEKEEEEVEEEEQGKKSSTLKRTVEVSSDLQVSKKRSRKNEKSSPKRRLDWDSLSSLRDMLKIMSCRQHTSGCLTQNQLRFHVKDEFITDRVSESMMKRWYETDATVSGFGDVKTQETKIDLNVRNAKEMNSSQVQPSAELLAAVQDHWKENFYPKQIRVEFYKMNIYAKGGKFESHLDTPDKNLLGTTIVCVGDSTRDDGMLKEDGKQREWNERDFQVNGKEIKMGYRSMVSFFTDVQHAVLTVPCGHRATLAFKIYYDASKPTTDEDQSIENMKFGEIREKLFQEFIQYRPGYGLLLSHQYTRRDTVMKDVDQILVEVLKKISNTKCLLFPVVVKFRGSWSHDTYRDDEPSEFESSVYLLTNQVLAKALNKRIDSTTTELDREISKLEKIPFFSLADDSGLQWLFQHESEVEHTGNESRRGDENSIYVNFAVVVIPSSSSASN